MPKISLPVELWFSNAAGWQLTKVLVWIQFMNFLPGWIWQFCEYTEAQHCPPKLRLPFYLLKYTKSWPSFWSIHWNRSESDCISVLFFLLFWWNNFVFSLMKSIKFFSLFGSRESSCDMWDYFVGYLTQFS